MNRTLTTAPATSAELAPQARLLRNILYIDSSSGAISFFLCTLGGTWLSALTGIPASTLMIVALVVLIPYTIGLAYGASKPHLVQRTGQIALVLNSGWVLMSFAVPGLNLLPLTQIGQIVMLVQALVVIDFIIIQFIGLRRLATRA
ncbi:MAG: hypothetical protein Fur005_41790 [Roseiflexaceae bacterium]